MVVAKPAVTAYVRIEWRMLQSAANPGTSDVCVAAEDILHFFKNYPP